MKTFTVIFYRHFGKWCTTVPFETIELAVAHREKHLKLALARGSIDRIVFQEVELPE